MIPYLSPRHESQLEYEIVRVIQNAARKVRPKLGIMSPLPVFGKKPDFTSQFRQVQQETVTIDPPWYVISELMKDYQVVQVPMDAPEIPDGIDALIVIHPSGILPRSQFALDQFVLRGGNLAVFADPRSFYAVLKSRKEYSLLEMFKSDLDLLFRNWGVIYRPEFLVADMVSAYRNKLPDRIVTNPTVLNLQKDRFSGTAPETSGLNHIAMYFSGSFAIEKKEGITGEVLLETSGESQIVSAEVNRPELILRRFKASGEKYPLAVHLEGMYTTAFPEGAPDPTALRKNTEILKRSRAKSRIYLFADSDMLFNDVCIAKVPDVTGQLIWAPSCDNVTLLLNVADQLTGQRSLAKVRSRIPMSRPLTRFNEIKAAAELRYRDKILKAEKEYLLSSRRLQQMKQIMRARPSQEMMRQMRTEENKNKSARHELNQLRHTLRAELEQLETRIKVINLVVIPGIIALLGIVYAVIRHSIMTRRSKS